MPLSYARLEERFRRLGHLQHVAGILHWDEAVMMARGAGTRRADAMATLDGLMHARLTDAAVVDDLDAAAEESAAGTLSAWQVANLREARRLVRRAQAVPGALVEQLTQARLRAEQAWRTLRPTSDWDAFAPLLSEVVDLKRTEASHLGDALGLSPYDALMDAFEPGCRAATVDRWFAELKTTLPELIDAVLARQASEPVVSPRGPFPVASQEALGRRLMGAVGFDMARGRLDVSHHPFCGGVPSDVRITTRYDEDDFVSALMGVLHETGHGKYEQGLPPAWEGQPVGAARGMAAHEGQSLLQEMQISRSPAFLRFAADAIRQAFPDAVSAQPEAFELSNLERLYTRVARDYIRVDADEVTYPCHVIVRYDIERPLIEGTLEVKEIPEAWDAGMRRWLQLPTGDDHNRGCMQDVHWAAGLFGYFPTYTLGAMTAAQVFAAAAQALPQLPEQIERGDFGALNDWLKQRIWSQASLHDSEGLMRFATGEALQPQYLLDHLRNRYLG